jgi:hypothetical protein
VGGYGGHLWVTDNRFMIVYYSLVPILIILYADPKRLIFEFSKQVAWQTGIEDDGWYLADKDQVQR